MFSSTSEEMFILLLSLHLSAIFVNANVTCSSQCESHFSNFIDLNYEENYDFEGIEFVSS